VGVPIGRLSKWFVITEKDIIVHCIFNYLLGLFFPNLGYSDFTASARDKVSISGDGNAKGI